MADCCLVRSFSFSAKVRASRSAGPPAAAITTMRIGLAGYSCAGAAHGINPRTNTAHAANNAARRWNARFMRSPREPAVFFADNYRSGATRVNKREAGSAGHGGAPAEAGPGDRIGAALGRFAGRDGGVPFPRNDAP